LFFVLVFSSKITDEGGAADFISPSLSALLADVSLHIGYQPLFL
jgi:hypothetical protein